VLLTRLSSTLISISLEGKLLRREAQSLLEALSKLEENKKEDEQEMNKPNTTLKLIINRSLLKIQVQA
jgi:hypothetical protein